MNPSKISLHELLVFAAFSHTKGEWLTNDEVAARVTPSVRPRTVRLHTKRLADAGILDQAPLFPAHRYRLTEHVPQRGTSYLTRLHGAAEVFGVSLAISD
jgi:hypothetical protein